MNKKSTIGIVLLVAMVLAKAYLFNYDTSNAKIAGVDSSVSSVDALGITGGDYLPASNIQPKSELIAANLTAPDLDDFKKRSQKNETFQSDIILNDVASSNDTRNEGEIIPMDVVSNTGYGLWRASSSEENTAPNEINSSEGKVPLDRGNTITGDLSRLFPRTP